MTLTSISETLWNATTQWFSRRTSIVQSCESWNEHRAVSFSIQQFSEGDTAISDYVMERYHLMVLQTNVADPRVDIVGHKQDARDVQYTFADFTLHFQNLYDLEGEAALDFTRAACRIVATFLYPRIWVLLTKT
jgi:hypothetical protein